MKTNKCTSFVSVHFTRFVSNKFTSSVASVPAIVDDDKKLEFSSQRLRQTVTKVQIQNRSKQRFSNV